MRTARRRRARQRRAAQRDKVRAPIVLLPAFATALDAQLRLLREDHDRELRRIFLGSSIGAGIAGSYAAAGIGGSYAAAMAQLWIKVTSSA